jgi:DNA-binding transcriptional regulator YiaG
MASGSSAMSMAVTGSVANLDAWEYGARQPKSKARTSMTVRYRDILLLHQG